MPSIVLHCPNCRQPYQMSPELITKYAGRTITCRKCKQPFAFDAAMDAAAQAAGQAEPEEEASALATGASGAAGAGADEGQGAYATEQTFAPPAPAAVPPPPPAPRRPVAPRSAPAYPPPQAPQPPPAYTPQAYAPPPTTPAGYSPAAPQVSRVGGIGDIFGFQRMALPALLPLVFWIGVACFLYNGLRVLLGLVLVSEFHNVGSGKHVASMLTTRLTFEGFPDRLISMNGLCTLIDALFWFILGPLFWRGFCELVLAASRLLAASERQSA